MLTRRQEAFVEEYLIDLNGTKAAIRAGYAPASAGVEAHRLLNQPDIAGAVSRGMAQRAVRTGIQQDMVLNELAHIAFSRVDHYAVDDETGDLQLSDGAPFGALAAVQSVRHRKRVRVETDGDVLTTYEGEIRLWDKVAALLLLGKHLGLFANRGPGPNGSPIDTVTRIERVIIELPAGTLAVVPSTDGANPAREEHLLKG